MAEGGAGEEAGFLPRDTNVLERAERLLAEPTAATVYLLRHANAGNRNGASEADHERPLSQRGRRQVAAVTRRMLRMPIGRIETSYFIRCEESVGPLAAALDLSLGHEPSLVEGGAPEHAIQFMHSLRSVAAVLCSHGDIISGIVGQLAAEGVELPPPLAWKKASVWELDLTKGRVVAGRYVPPPP